MRYRYDFLAPLAHKHSTLLKTNITANYSVLTTTSAFSLPKLIFCCVKTCLKLSAVCHWVIQYDQI